MLVFIDESGDTGLKLDKHSSRYFTIVLVVFDDNKDADSCYKKIESLKQELKPSCGEFKFNKLKRKDREKFLHDVLPYSFYYFAIVINKDPKKLIGKGFEFKESFYKYTCRLVFENARAYLKDSIIVFDGSGSRIFKKQFTTYIKKTLGQGAVKKMEIQTSHSNNLLQLADMIAGSIQRSMTEKEDKNIYRGIIRNREMNLQIWPK